MMTSRGITPVSAKTWLRTSFPWAMTQVAMSRLNIGSSSAVGKATVIGFVPRLRSALRVVRQIRRDAAIHTAVTERAANDLTVRMEMEQVFAIEMDVVSRAQAAMLERTFKNNAEAIYQTLLSAMTADYETEKEDETP